MSGICGWIGFDAEAPVKSATLSRMVGTLRIAPEGTAVTVQHNGVAGAALGCKADDHGTAEWNGLRAIFQGHLRWREQDDQDLARKLGDARALLESYSRLGPAFLQRLQGPFALAILDDSRDRALLAVDRLGIRPLFYSQRRGTLVFASNARAINRHPAADASLSPQALFDYLYFHMVPGPRSIYAAQQKLLPGQYLLFENGEVRTDFYWQPRFEENTSLSTGQLRENFLHSLENAVLRASAGGEIGAFLSGGTDSSTVAGLLRKVSGRAVDTYSIGFEAEGFDETEYARIAARHFDTQAHEYYLTPQDVVDAISKIAAAYDEPFGNASAVPAYYCAKLARADGLDTLLAGDGGDELFAGNARYAKQKIFESYQVLPSVLRGSILEPLVFNHRLDAFPLVGKARSYIEQANTPLPDRLEAYNFLNRFPLEELFTVDFLNQVERDDPLNQLRATYRRADADSSLNRMLFLDWKFTLADNDLRKVNRMCELAGVEARYPLLDEELVDFSTQLPSSLKLRGQHLRYFFKDALKDFLPPEILQKSKHGFGLPFGLWLGSYGPLEELAHDSLQGLGKRGHVQPAFLDKLLILHREHPNYYGVMIWVLMMLEQWLRTEENFRSAAE
ncbi:asparagine synthase (glutamine-hydrolyzing) [Methylococcus sp. EFPC2]|uniref:asparagine synthase (glutamine-hydrolyzing) n=1 Tax=Methylococcus sp. EFPC2 TaxID=2812648 RepID=UPI001967E711|nr:asparagine synthase (glutamine-hydrolyzing) [Methylococcus sp. EFPC2]QSA98574.1 asparagine synthase (glutamine-hydrolyzing) [Methylococcus sp. EFPC2]